jgi:hypothetical protein
MSTFPVPVKNNVVVGVPDGDLEDTYWQQNRACSRGCRANEVERPATEHVGASHENRLGHPGAFARCRGRI